MDSTFRRTPRRLALALLVSIAAFALASAAGPSIERAPAAQAKSGVLKGWPTTKGLAVEFMRLLKRQDRPGLRRYLDPAFLIQRGDGSFLDRKRYLRNPPVVHAFRLRGIVGTHNQDVRVVRYEAKTDQIIDGSKVPGVWIPRLSTFKRTNGAWRLVAHANFLPPPTERASGTGRSTARAAVAGARSGVLRGWPSRRRLATEFLRLLQAKDKPGLRRFLDPAFLLQRGDGSYLKKRRYIQDPSLVDGFKVRRATATHNGDVRVLRFEAKTDQIVNGNKVPGVWIPRLSTFKRTNGAWRLISHANFLPPPTS